MNDENDSIRSFFRLTMLASGTPSAYQKAVSENREHRKNTCECSPSDAIAGRMVRRPELNMITGSAETDFPKALAAVLSREIETCAKEPFLPRILVNCSGRDQIRSIVASPFFADGAGRRFHVITIHSPKEYEENNRVLTFGSTVDGRETDSSEAYDAIEKLDSGFFGDELPVFVFQVGMIGEGINVRCFNSAVVTTHSDRTAMQQIGRIMRNYRASAEGPDKISAGHAAAYAFVENVADLRRLVLNLQDYGLTSDCYDWGREIDVFAGSGTEQDEDGVPAGLNGFEWNDIDVEIVQLISASADSREGAACRSRFAQRLLDEMPDAVADFMEAMKSEPEYFREFKIADRTTGFSRRSLRDELAERSREKREGEPAGRKAGAKSSVAKSAEEMVFSHLSALMEYLDTHRDAAREIWPVDKKAVLDEVFANDTVARFFAGAIKGDFEKRLIGKFGRPGANLTAENRTIDRVKENEECPETSVTKPTDAAPTPIPGSTSGSSKSTSGGTGKSGVLRWLTSLLRR